MSYNSVEKLSRMYEDLCMNDIMKQILDKSFRLDVEIGSAKEVPEH